MLLWLPSGVVNTASYAILIRSNPGWMHIITVSVALVICTVKMITSNCSDSLALTNTAFPPKLAGLTGFLNTDQTAKNGLLIPRL